MLVMFRISRYVTLNIHNVILHVYYSTKFNPIVLRLTSLSYRLHPVELVERKRLF